MNKQEKEKAIQALTSGSVVVMPSDTIYGIFVSVYSKSAIESLYRLRGRDTKKPCIILCADINQIQAFVKPLTSAKQNQLATFLRSSQYKQKPTTFILHSKKLSHLSRGTMTLAFRIPGEKTKRSRDLQCILKKTGPLLAPSANLAGKKPAQTITEAKKYFGSSVDLYVSHGRKLEAKPSQIFDLTGSEIRKLR